MRAHALVALAASLAACAPKFAARGPMAPADLWAPGLRNKIAIGDITATSGQHFLIAAARLNGGSVENIDPGFRAIRELRPSVVTLYTQADRRRFLVRPGITCLWQVGNRQGGAFEFGNRHNIDFPEQVNLDVRYIESQSVWRDLWILAKTVPAILFGKGM